jgi:hypothetical protein
MKTVYTFIVILMLSIIASTIAKSQSTVTDSTTVFNISDTKKIRSMLEDYKYMSTQLPVCERLVDELLIDQQISDSINANLHQIIYNDYQIMSNDMIIISSLKSDNDRLIKQNKSDKRKYRLKLAGISIAAIAAIIFL